MKFTKLYKKQQTMLNAKIHVFDLIYSTVSLFVIIIFVSIQNYIYIIRIKK